MLIAICEDEKNELVKIRSMVSEIAGKYFGEYSVDGYERTEDFIACMRNNPPDILFSDIYMDEMTGIQVARETKKLQKQVEIVFLTTSMEHLLDSYEVDAAHYLLKPASKDKIEEAMKRCMKRLGVDESFCEFKIGKTNIRLLEKSINYLETMGNTTLIHTDHDDYKVYQTLKVIENKLSNTAFLKIQRGIIVNMKYIKQLNSDECILRNSLIFNLSRKEKNVIREKYMEYKFDCARKRGD